MVEISKYGSGEGRPREIGGAYSTGDDGNSKKSLRKSLRFLSVNPGSLSCLGQQCCFPLAP